MPRTSAFFDLAVSRFGEAKTIEATEVFLRNERLFIKDESGGLKGEAVSFGILVLNKKWVKLFEENKRGINPVLSRHNGSVLP